MRHLQVDQGVVQAFVVAPEIAVAQKCQPWAFPEFADTPFQQPGNLIRR
jgi:hypothetical protein